MNVVQFPGLWSLEFAIRRWAFEVFGIRIYWYGIIIALGFLLAVLLGMKSSRKYGLEPDNILDLVLFAAPVAIVTARLYYVIFSFDQFRDNPIDIINTRKGGLAILGGIIGALLVGFIFARKKKIGVLKLFDFCVPYVIMAQGIGRWGNFINQEAFGTATRLPWRMNSDIANEYLNSLGQNLDLKQWGVHPTFLYESLWDFAIFFFLLWYRKRKKLDGEVFFLYLILYGIGRFFIEGLRTDSLMAGSFRISQVLSAVFAIASVVVIIYMRRRKVRETDDEPDEIGQSTYGTVLMKLKEDEEKAQAEDSNSESGHTDKESSGLAVNDTHEEPSEESDNDATKDKTE